jgi:leucyl aminopeptidase
VHLDIAGPAFNNGRAHGYTPKGGTGAGVRTIIAAVERLAGAAR